MRSDKLRLWKRFIIGRSIATGVFLGLIVAIGRIVHIAPLLPLTLISTVQFLANGLYLFLWHRRDMAFLGYMSFYLEIALITILVYFLGTDGHAFVLAYMWPIIMGGWLRGRQAIPPLTLLSAIGFLILALLRRYELMPLIQLTLPDGTSLALLLGLPYLAFISLLVWLMASEMESSEENLHKRNEELRRSNDNLHSLVATGEEFLGRTELSQLLSSAIDQAEQLTGESRAAIHLWRAGELHIEETHDLSTALRERIGALHFANPSPTSHREGKEIAILQESLVGDETVEAAILTHVALRSPRNLEGVLTLVSSNMPDLDKSTLQGLQILGHLLGTALENVRLLDRLQHDRNLLRGILAHMAEGVTVVDNTGNILLANRAAAKLLDIHENHSLPEWFSKTLGDADKREDRRCLIEYRGRTVSISVAELPGDSKALPSTIYVARDITQEAQAEQLKSDFVAYASHELRTPLTTIRMLTRLLLMDTPKDSQAQEYLSIINTQTERQIRMVRNLLDFTKLEAGQYDLTMQPVDPGQIIKTAYETCRLLAEQKSQTVMIECSEHSANLIGNNGGLEQVLINLLSNAIKFTPEGGHIITRFLQYPQEVVFSVEDDGIGMTEQQLGHIFTKFYTVRNPKKHGEGTGLGLVISDMIVKQLGGTISVKSEPGRGSRFEVRLPQIASLAEDADQ